MSFNKIQPEQMQLATFFSDSGDVNVTQTDTGIILNVSRGMTGDFNFSGQLKSNAKTVLAMPDVGTNKFTVASGNILLAGSNTELAGFLDHSKDNLALRADGCDVSGQNNLIVLGNNVDFTTGSQSNVAVAGRNVTFTNEATGSVVIKDNKTTLQSVNRSDALFVNFNSGHYFEGGQTFFNSSASFNSSGIISGSLEVHGSGFLTGQEIVTKHYLTGSFVNNYEDQDIEATKRFQTGFQLPEWLGNQSQAGPAQAPATGALAISGDTLLVYKGNAVWRGIAISGATP